MRPEELGIGTLFGRIREAVIVADATTQRIVLWNPAATNIFGYSISEALELNIEKLVPDTLKAQHRAGITRYAETGHGPYIDSRRLLELPALTKSGEEIYVELSLSPIGLVDDTNGGRRFVLAIVRDVTERKRAEDSPDTERSQADLEQALKLIRQTISDARRISATLRPTVLDDFGLPAAISLEVQRLREEGYRVEYEEGLGDERLPAMAENALFRVVQEALTNIQQHGQTRKMRIELRRREDEVYLEIRDYGRGFDLEATSPSSELGKTVGIARMREWALLLSGQLEIHTKPGRGTSVLAKVPLPAHEGSFRSRSETP
jgi:PAS domain S-box-containing protein